MKKICFILMMLLALLGLVGCGAGTGDTENSDASGPRELTENQTVEGNIAAEGEVDWYSFNAVEVNRTLTIDCTGTYPEAPVDFMMTVYEKDGNGNLVPLFGRSAPEDAVQPADLQIGVHIDQPRRLLIAVRDFMDDDASDRIPYRLKAHYTEAATDTGTFDQAQTLTVDAADCLTDSITEIGEVNTYRFTIETEGVYRLAAQYNVSNASSVDVNLGIELYDEGGLLVYQYKGGRPQDLSYEVIVHLVPGTYFVAVDDQGHNDVDYAEYTICVDSMTVIEMAVNDTLVDAQQADFETDEYVMDGSLEYLQDQDWYRLPVPAASGTAVQNLVIQFVRDMVTLPESISRLTDPGSYRITVQDEAGDILHVYNYAVTSSSTYSVQIPAGQGEQHYLMVQPVIDGQMVAALPYQLRVELVEVTDENENGDTATILTPPSEVTGKIATLGDVDNYQVTLDTSSAPKVLELEFKTAVSSMVDFTVHTSWEVEDGDDEDEENDIVHMLLKDTNGTQEGDHCKAGYYFPQKAEPTVVTIQVADDQNNDGGDVQYTLTVGVLDIPTGLPAAPGVVGTATPVYQAEPIEQADSAGVDVTVVEYDSYDQPVHRANTSLLKVGTLDAGNQWQSNWIAGFVDYDGDRDLFRLDFDDAIAAAGSPAQWYFDIQVQFYTAGGSVEYGWTLFRDGPVGDDDVPNNTLLERTFWEGQSSGGVYEYNIDAEGVVACWADMDTNSVEQNVTVPRAGVDGEVLWIGSEWRTSNFYISIQDFNRANVSATYNDITESWEYTPNQVPDNDWGNTNSSEPPYYFQVTVTLHTDSSRPPQ